MKKSIYFLSAIAFMSMMATGCQEDDYQFMDNPNEFAVNPIAVVADADGGSYEIKITGKGEWTAKYGETNTSAEGWCVLSQTSGNGETTLTVDVTASGSFTKRRSMMMEFTSGDRTLKCRLIQGTQVLGEKEVLINGIVWSTVNVNEPGTFCETPAEVGMCYQFNSKKPWPFKSNPDGWSKNYDYDANNTNWLPENDPSPEGWRIPTGAEVATLFDKGAVWKGAAKSGYGVAGYFLGVSAENAELISADNCRSLGALFIPKSGWLTLDGVIDRDWLAVIRTSTSLSKTHGGMFLGNDGYQDVWGWGDGQKERAAPIRPVKILEVEE